MALPYVTPVPPGTPMTMSPPGVPGTGPYAVAEFTPQRSLRLERNPHFRSWSGAARPPAYPDAITWTLRPDARLVPEVLAGRFDQTNLFFAPQTAVDDVVLQAPAQVHTELVTATFFLIPNTSRPPFDDPTVRRSLSLAVDRGRLADILRGRPEAATCGLLPPDMPGYESYCPTAALARPLGAVAGAQPGPGAAADRPLGCRRQPGRRLLAKVEPAVRSSRPLPSPAPRPGLRRGAALDPERRLRGAVRPVVPRLVCRLPLGVQLLRAPALLRFRREPWPDRDRGLDALAERASALSDTDPGESHRLWQQVYRTVSDRVPVIPVFNGVHYYLASERVGNYQDGAFVGPLYDQMWVR